MNLASTLLTTVRAAKMTTNQEALALADDYERGLKQLIARIEGQGDVVEFAEAGNEPFNDSQTHQYEKVITAYRAALVEIIAMISPVVTAGDALSRAARSADMIGDGFVHERGQWAIACAAIESAVDRHMENLNGLGVRDVTANKQQGEQS